MKIMFGKYSVPETANKHNDVFFFVFFFPDRTKMHKQMITCSPFKNGLNAKHWLASRGTLKSVLN